MFQRERERERSRERETRERETRETEKRETEKRETEKRETEMSAGDSRLISIGIFPFFCFVVALVVYFCIAIL